MNPKQERFVDEYLIDLNAKQAAIRAGYTPTRAEQTGCDLVRNRKVARAIAERQAERRAMLKMTADDVVISLAQVARASIADVVDWGVKDVAIGYDAEGKKLAPEDIDDAVVVHYVEQPYVRPVARDDLAPEVQAAVAEVALTESGAFRIKMHDKLAALDKLGRHLGVFKEDAASPVTVNFIITGLYEEAHEPAPAKREGSHTFRDPAR